ncbi:DUF262 domain-containing protein [Catellicoccus marimammalium]|uniref:DUF262 domain-containing protein n=1 Tax=Catellicoccus marimammalium M35/04/3 TaxID=1234409 RepID=K8Z8X7_9ENTE|nr:DUF262 domain-containing protein [Catellicoccus marimammalium]EKU27479.1 hypothetical protein C683_0810 [Catellicoccus marimammalium M35/04/3]
MKEIVARSQKVKSFLDDNYFRIPVYQRRYSWGETEIETLMDDIKNNSEGYYIGNILLAKSDKEDKDVVDGQQRLTTIFLILLAIYEQYYLLIKKGENSFNYLKRFENISEELGLKEIPLDDLDENEPLRLENLKLLLLEKDKKLLECCIEAAQSQNKETTKPSYANQKLVKSYLYIRSYLETEIIEEEIESKKIFKRLTEFEKKVQEAVVLPIILEDLSDVFSIFSSMNSKGQPLTTIDLLKADYLSYSQENQEEALKEWQTFISLLSFDKKKDEVKKGDADRFLQNNYDAFCSTTSSSITVKQSLRKYQDLIRKRVEEDRSVLPFIKELQKTALIYRQIEQPEEKQEALKEVLNEEIFDLLKQLKLLDTNSAYPLLFFLLQERRKENVSKEKLAEILEYLVHLFVRRNTIKVPKASNLRGQLLGILRRIEKKENIDYEKDLLAELKKIADKYLSDDKFQSSLSGSVYSEFTKTTRFMLVGIERNAHKEGKAFYFDKQNQDSLDEKDKKGYRWEIEHIFPQDENLPSPWRKMISEEDDEKAKEKHQLYKDKLGNLTLTGYNSGMGNRSFQEKRDYKHNGKYVGLKTPLYLNSSIAEGNIDEKKDWTLDDIDRRTKNLIQELITIYNI